MEGNPYLQQENYLEGYQKSVEELKNKPAIIEFDKLCYELFEMNETGKRFLELATERYLIQSLAGRGNATYQIDVLWAEGFKDAFRLFLNCVNSHKQRIQAGKNS